MKNRIKILLKYENSKIYGFVPEYGISVTGCCKEQVLFKVEKIVKHLLHKGLE